MKEARYRLAIVFLVLVVQVVVLWQDYVSIYIVLALWVGYSVGSFVTHSFYSKSQLDVDIED